MTPLQLKLARTALGMSIRELAVVADVAPSTIVRLESAGAGTQRRTVDQLQRCLEERGIVFLPADDSGAATVRLRK